MVGRLIGHVLLFGFAVAIGWLHAMVTGFGCAVGDYQDVCSGSDLNRIWIETTLVVLVACYAVYLLVGVVKRRLARGN